MLSMRSTPRLRAVAPGLLAAALVGCGAGESALAEVGGRQLDIVSFQIHIGRVTGETWEAVSAVVSSRLLDQYIDRQVVVESARRAGLPLARDPSMLGPAEVQMLLDELCGSAPEPASHEVAAEVGARIANERPAQAHIRQVLVDTLEEAEAARERLLAGEDFELISREMSRAPNAASGGDLGFFEQGSLTPEIDDVVFALGEEEFSGPVQGPSGYHVFQVLEVVPAGPPDLSEVEAAVRSELAQHGERRHTRHCIERLGSEVGVEVFTDHLWFEYAGRYSKEGHHA